MVKIGYWAFFASVAIGTVQSNEIANAGNFRDKDSWCKQVATLDSALGATSSLARVAGLSDGDLVRARPKSVLVAAGQTVSDIVAKNGFLPDQSNLEIVSYLNPSIRDINNINKNESIIIPSFEIFRDSKWVEYKPNSPIDGFALNHRTAPRLKYALQVDSSELKKNIDSLYANGNLNIDEKSIFDKYLAEAGKIEKPTWTDYTGSVAVSDSYIAFAQQSNDIARTLVDAKGEGVTLPHDTLMTMAALQQSASDTGKPSDVVAVSINTEDASGNKIEGLNLKYMSSGAFEIGCDRKRDAHGFATPSYNATQALKRLKWYIWAEDGTSSVVTEYREIDLTTVSDVKFVNKTVAKK
ncbi:hypothetical protein [Mesorhizobium sp. M0772]|uniref:hypothetical protein n=1 Tax=Mesorhizobium sp. M0772 TaxID=2956998 RepID=UPI00333A573F